LAKIIGESPASRRRSAASRICGKSPAIRLERAAISPRMAQAWYGGQEAIMYAVAKRLLLDKGGTTAMEYGLIGALISVFIIGALTLVGSNLAGTNGPLIAAANALASAS
jgi:pilus assembly protein Flp/PilA